MNKALFDHIESASPTKKFLVTVSYLEVTKVLFVHELSNAMVNVQIYQEVIHDLLNPHGKDMKVRQHPQFGVYVCMLTKPLRYVMPSKPQLRGRSS